MTPVSEQSQTPPVPPPQERRRAFSIDLFAPSRRRIAQHAAPRHHWSAIALITLADQVAIVASSLIALPLSGMVPADWVSLLVPVLSYAVVFAGSAYWRRLYHFDRMETVARQAMPLVYALAQGFVCAAAVSALLDLDVPHMARWLCTWFAVCAAAICLPRIAFWTLQRRADMLAIYARRVVIFGGAEAAAKLVRELTEHRSNHRVVGVLLSDKEHWRDTLLARGLHVFSHIAEYSNFAQLSQAAQAGEFDELLIVSAKAGDLMSPPPLRQVEELPCAIKYCIPGDFISRPLSDIALIGHQPVVTVHRAMLSGTAQFLKRIEDVVISLILIALASPLMLLCAAMIALDGQGQIIFRQKRHGFNGREFEIFKFRSMRVMPAENDPMPAQATRHDPRITPVGRVLRKLSLDELPQLFNVLIGDMSIVGPRPHAVMHNYYYKELIEGYAARQRIKPGITGWAQVNGWRGETDTLEKMRKRIEHDLYYAENWSIWLDLKIILLTAFTVFSHQNAY